MQDLGIVLSQRGLLKPEQLKLALLEQSVTKERLGKILIRNGYVRQDDLFRVLRELDPNSLHGESVFQSVIAPEMLLETRSMVVATVENALYLSTLSTPAAVRQRIAPEVGGRKIFFTPAQAVRVSDYLRQIRDTVGATKLTWEKIFHEAMRVKASDIHIYPQPYSYTVMLRLDGVLHPIHAGTLDEYIGLVTRVKDLAKMDMAERRRNQDGGFALEYSGRVVSFRVTTLPVVNGEKMVVRILDPDSVNRRLDELGITKVDAWVNATALSDGLCLICGPTGSGKTTTLAATEREMNVFERAIYTAEEPVEFLVPFAGQVNVNEQVGLTFSNAIRAFMRADPDVIVVGEVRDIDTARNALKAAETGHMAIATLHTDSIVSTFGRLRDIGVPSYELVHLLRGVMVQRLMRVYCKECKGVGRLTRHRGGELTCPICNGSGYRGREVISEVTSFKNPDEVEAALNGKITWRTLKQDAKDKVLAGKTSEYELHRVLGLRLADIPD